MNEDFYSHFGNSYIQTFDDTKSGNRQFVSCFPASELAERSKWLAEGNKLGMGVFFTPNACVGGRKESNITEINWLYADLDDYTYDEMVMKVDTSPIPPQVIVSSGRGFHFYWKCTCTAEQFKQIIQGIIFHFDSDPAISSSNEVLRIPGFYHMKDPQSPRLVEILDYDLSRTITIAEMIEAYPEPAKQTQKKYKLQSDELSIIKDIPIKDVLIKLGVEIKRNTIWLNGEETSAHINEKGNYINRFSGKDGSGSTIDAVMGYGEMTTSEAICWLKDLAGIDDHSPERLAKAIIAHEEKPITSTKIFTWGTEQLNKKITPIQQHHFILVTGNSGAGKTAFCFDVALKNAQEGKKVLFLSLEMTKHELRSRVSRNYAGITKQDWRDPSTISEHKNKAFKKKMKELEKNKNLILQGFSRDQVATTEVIFAIIAELSPDLVFIDNFDLIHKNGAVSEYSEQNRVAQELMDFTNQVHTPLIVLHHHRKGKDSGLDVVRGSGKITHNSDSVLTCKREYDEDSDDKANAAFTVAQVKDRDFGQLAIAVVYFNKGTFNDEYMAGPIIVDPARPHWQDQ